MKKHTTVADLISALQQTDPSMPVGLEVYQHCWFSPTHTEELNVSIVRIHYAAGDSQDVAVLSPGQFSHNANGYRPLVIRERVV